MRSPLLHFLLIGALLVALRHGVSVLAHGTVSGPQVALAASDEELLFAEAVDLGLHRRDSLVMRRLVRDMQFLRGPHRTTGEGAGEASHPEALFRDALALGLHEADLVVRRRLVQKLKLALKAAVRDEAPSQEELDRYLDDHPEAFEQPATWQISQVFLSRRVRGEKLDASARQLLRRLRDGVVPPERAAFFGDPLLMASALPPLSAKQLEGLFGRAFVAEIDRLETRAWGGPVASAYGLHLVWLHAHRPPRPARLGEVRSAVREALVEERSRARLEAQLASLRVAAP